MNYPTEEYHSYGECDDHYITRSLPDGFKPFWAVDKLSLATNSFSIETVAYNEDKTGAAQSGSNYYRF